MLVASGCHIFEGIDKGIVQESAVIACGAEKFEDIRLGSRLPSAPRDSINLLI
jgi:hypothetical protein